MNRQGEPSKKYGYHSRDFKPKIHSELDAIRRCIRGLHDLDVINVRLSRSGEMRNSFPCSACRNLLFCLNVERIYFTTERGWGMM